MAGPDLSGLSDADVKALAAGDMKSVSEAGLRHLAGAPPPPPAHYAPDIGLADVAATGVSAMARGAVNAGQDLYNRVVHGEPTPPGQEIAGHAELGPAGKDFMASLPSIPAPIKEGAAAVEGAYKRGYEALGQRSPVSQDIVRNAAGVGQDVLNLSPAAEETATGATAVAARTAAREAAIPSVAGRLVNAGYKLRPSTVEEMAPESAGKVPGSTRQTQLETPSDVRQLNMDNAVNTNRRINNQIGAQGTMDEDLEAAKAPHNETYNRAADTVPAGQPATGGLDAKLDNVARNSQATSTAAQGQIEKLVANVKDNYKDGVSGRQLIDDMSTYRAKARKLFNTDQPDNWDIAAAHRKVADALEDELAAHLQPGELADFQNARQSLAQINNAQTALRGGSYDPAILARMRAKGIPLSGALEDAAIGGEYAPKDVVHPQSAPQAEGIGEVHTMMGAAGRAAQIAGKKLIPGATGSGPVTKAAQSAFEKYQLEHAQQHLHDLSELQPPPGSVSPPPPVQGEMPLPQPPARPAFDLAHPEGTAGVAPRQLEIPPGGSTITERNAAARVSSKLKGRRSPGEYVAALRGEPPEAQ